MEQGSWGCRCCMGRGGRCTPHPRPPLLLLSPMAPTRYRDPPRRIWLHFCFSETLVTLLSCLFSLLKILTSSANVRADTGSVGASLPVLWVWHQTWQCFSAVHLRPELPEPSDFTGSCVYIFIYIYPFIFPGTTRRGAGKIWENLSTYMLRNQGTTAEAVPAICSLKMGL